MRYIIVFIFLWMCNPAIGQNHFLSGVNPGLDMVITRMDKYNITGVESIPVDENFKKYQVPQPAIILNAVKRFNFFSNIKTETSLLQQSFAMESNSAIKKNSFSMTFTVQDLICLEWREKQFGFNSFLSAECEPILKYDLTADNMIKCSISYKFRK